MTTDTATETTIDLDVMPVEPTAEVTEVHLGLPATDRCDRCGAQAYVEAEIAYEHEGDGIAEYVRMKVLLCAHHATRPGGKKIDAEGKRLLDPKLVARATRIFDHRPFLEKQERMFHGGTA